MLDLYKKVAFVFVLLCLVTLVFLIVLSLNYYRTEQLFPANESLFPWHVETFGDTLSGGRAAVSFVDTSAGLTFEYVLSDKARYPFARLFMVFGSAKKSDLFLNLEAHSKVTFKVRCEHQNTLAFSLRTVDSQVTTEGDPGSLRVANHWLKCTQHWSTEEVDLRNLKVPEWWLNQYNVDGHDKTYRLDKVGAFAFTVAQYGPVGEKSSVQVSDLELHVSDQNFLRVILGFCAILWAVFFVWIFKLYLRVVNERLEKQAPVEKPAVEYRKLSLESHKKKEKSSVLQYMTSHYSNPNLSLDMLVNELGLNYKKINEILKAEIGCTFSTYLNKLRLEQAVRLLGETERMSINEIAQAVGYKNVTYFNKMFKEEFGCSPGKYKHRQ